jgi:hypothetical protein
MTTQPPTGGGRDAVISPGTGHSYGPVRPGACRDAARAARASARLKRLPVTGWGLAWLMVLPYVLGGSLGISVTALRSPAWVLAATTVVTSLVLIWLARLLVDVLGRPGR